MKLKELKILVDNQKRFHQEIMELIEQLQKYGESEEDIKQLLVSRIAVLAANRQSALVSPQVIFVPTSPSVSNTEFDAQFPLNQIRNHNTLTGNSLSDSSITELAGPITTTSPLDDTLFNDIYFIGLSQINNSASSHGFPSNSTTVNLNHFNDNDINGAILDSMTFTMPLSQHDYDGRQYASTQPIQSCNETNPYAEPFTTSLDDPFTHSQADSSESQICTPLM